MTDFQINRADTKTGGRYSLHVEGHDAEMTYSRTGPAEITIEHTEVPSALGGKGAGKALVVHAVEDARSEGWKIVPSCPFVKAQLDKHEEWQDVLK